MALAIMACVIAGLEEGKNGRDCQKDNEECSNYCSSCSHLSIIDDWSEIGNYWAEYLFRHDFSWSVWDQPHFPSVCFLQVALW